MHASTMALNSQVFNVTWLAEGGAEFAGPENDGPKKIKDWKMQDLENNGPNHRAGKCKTWKMTVQIAGR